MATPENKIEEQFRADALTIGAHLSASEAVLSGVEKPSLTNTFEIKAGTEGARIDLEVKGGGRESYSGTSGANFTASIFEALREKDRQRREANSQLITFLDLLDAINRQIAALDDQIAEYEEEKIQLEEQLGALEELRDLVESGELDPTNPEHMRLLELSDIPRDEWGVLTAAGLDKRINDTNDRIKDLDRKIGIAKDRRRKLEKDRDELHERMSEDPDLEVDPVTAKIAKDQRKQFYSAERELSETETEWFHRVMSIAPREDWDRLIDKLEDRSVSDIRTDDGLPLEVRDYLYVCEFEQLFDDLCSEEPADVHHFILMDRLENTQEADIQILLRSEETPEYIRAAMVELGMSTPDQNLGFHLHRDQ